MVCRREPVIETSSDEDCDSGLQCRTGEVFEALGVKAQFDAESHECAGELSRAHVRECTEKLLGRGRYLGSAPRDRRYCRDKSRGRRA